MLRKKLLLALVASIGLSGCLSSHYYVLSTASQPMHTYSYTKMSIGVEKVIVPEYLFKREIAIAKSSSEIVFLSDATWAEDLDASLTLRVISFLQKKFNQPNIHAYPWEFNTQPMKKVKVRVSRFIAQDDRVYLDATWEIENIRTQHKKAKLFTTSVALSKSDAGAVVEAMDKAFSKLEESIAQGLK